jgi:type IV pilus assembly protein PilB
MAVTTSKRLGDKLVEAGLITQEQLEFALREQKRTGKLLGETLRSLGFITGQDIADVLISDLGVERAEITKQITDGTITELVPREFAETHRIVPLYLDGDTLTVAMADPFDVPTIDFVKRQTHFQVEPVLASDSELARAMERAYGRDAAMEDLISRSLAQLGKIGEADVDDLALMTEVAAVAPVVELLDHMIATGVADAATDIHIQPEQGHLVIRYRVDGLLHQGTTLPKELQAALISRIKIMANLDIAERRLPQDGRVTFTVGNTKVDLRISVCPTIYGEDAVVRILDKTKLELELGSLGFQPEAASTFKNMLERAYGMILVTGPTGSGKTTTLYSALHILNTPDKGILTIEDPVEYELPFVRQTQVNVKAGLTFASGLRSMLRQDPDIVMVGEIRDLETAETAVRAALTGHLVLSTLHTNDAAGALPRLIDMGVEPFLAASSVIGVLAQRLVRRLCDVCKIPEEPSESMLEVLGLSDSKGITIYQPQGCEKCRGTGYRGRTAIVEMLTMNEKMRELVMSGSSADAIREAGKRSGMQTLEEDGYKKVLDGVTSFTEVMRVIRTS